MKTFNKENLLYLCCFIPLIGIFVIFKWVSTDRFYKLVGNPFYMLYQIYGNAIITLYFCHKYIHL